MLPVPAPTIDVNANAVTRTKLNQRLTWYPHTRLKCTEMKRRYKLFVRLLDNQRPIMRQNTIIKTIYTYGKEPWYSTKLSNPFKYYLKCIYIFHNSSKNHRYPLLLCLELKRRIAIHSDFDAPFVQESASIRYQLLHSKLNTRANPLI